MRAGHLVRLTASQEDLMNTLALRTSAACLSLGLAFAVSAPAQAKDADMVKRGSCSGAAHWKLKASPEDGRIEVQGEVDTNVVGRAWHWRIRHNGTVSARGTATTGAPSGSFEVRRVLVNAAGTDSIKWRARDAKTGQTCRGGLKF
jgi:hypothetical protein